MEEMDVGENVFCDVGGRSDVVLMSLVDSASSSRFLHTLTP